MSDGINRFSYRKKEQADHSMDGRSIIRELFREL